MGSMVRQEGAGAAMTLGGGIAGISAEGGGAVVCGAWGESEGLDDASSMERSEAVRRKVTVTPASNRARRFLRIWAERRVGSGARSEERRVGKECRSGGAREL